MLQFECYMVTDVGKIRSNNEDNFYLDGVYKNNTDIKNYHAQKCVPEEGYFAVFDGMGGEEHGEHASLLAAKTLEEYQKKGKEFTASEYVENANRKICQLIESNHGVRSGTTLVMLDISKNHAVCYNIGDSRGYLFREGVLTQLSEDHTMTARMVKLGVLTAEQARTHKQRHVLTQHLGIFEDELFIEAYTSEKIFVLPKDCFVLCSDGLTDALSDAEIESILQKNLSPQESAEILKQAAMEKGSKDNVTVGVIKAVEKKTGLFANMWRKY